MRRNTACIGSIYYKHLTCECHDVNAETRGRETVDYPIFSEERWLVEIRDNPHYLVQRAIIYDRNKFKTDATEHDVPSTVDFLDKIVSRPRTDEPPYTYPLCPTVPKNMSVMSNLSVQVAKNKLKEAVPTVSLRMYFAYRMIRAIAAMPFTLKHWYNDCPHACLFERNGLCPVKRSHETPRYTETLTLADMFVPAQHLPLLLDMRDCKTCPQNDIKDLVEWFVRREIVCLSMRTHHAYRHDKHCEMIPVDAVNLDEMNPRLLATAICTIGFEPLKEVMSTLAAVRHMLDANGVHYYHWCSNAKLRVLTYIMKRIGSALAASGIHRTLHDAYLVHSMLCAEHLPTARTLQWYRSHFGIFFTHIMKRLRVDFIPMLTLNLPRTTTSDVLLDLYLRLYMLYFRDYAYFSKPTVNVTPRYGVVAYPVQRSQAEKVYYSLSESATFNSDCSDHYSHVRMPQKREDFDKLFKVMKSVHYNPTAFPSLVKELRATLCKKPVRKLKAGPRKRYAFHDINSYRDLKHRIHKISHHARDWIYVNDPIEFYSMCISYTYPRLAPTLKHFYISRM